jgi:hypothetical protein
MSRVAECHFRRKREAPLILREARHNSGAIPGPGRPVASDFPRSTRRGAWLTQLRSICCNGLTTSPRVKGEGLCQ